MGKWGYTVNAVSFVTIIFFNICFCFPYSLPVATSTMNYNSVILVGVAFLTMVWWFAHGLRKYPGPKLSMEEETPEGPRRLSTV
jgi:hypothetical protein